MLYVCIHVLPVDGNGSNSLCYYMPCIFVVITIILQIIATLAAENTINVAVYEYLPKILWLLVVIFLYYGHIETVSENEKHICHQTKVYCICTMVWGFIMSIVLIRHHQLYAMVASSFFLMLGLGLIIAAKYSLRTTQGDIEPKAAFGVIISIIAFIAYFCLSLYQLGGPVPMGLAICLVLVIENLLFTI